MDNLSKTSKFFLVMIVICASIWLGTYISRYLLIYGLFEPPTLDLKKEYLDLNLLPILRGIADLALFQMVIYVILLVFFILFLIFSGLNLKIEGWLFIITVLIFLSVPIEIYSITLDYKLIHGIYYNSGSPDALLDMVVRRVDLLGGISLMEIFSFSAILILLFLKPFRKIK